jgi:hypothetical protein
MSRISIIKNRPILPALGLCLLAMLSGCGTSGNQPAAAPKGPDRNNPDFAKDAATLFPKNGQRPAAPGQAAQPPAGWSIVLLAAKDADVARQALERVRTRGGLNDAYVEQRGKAYVIAYGNYKDATSREAQSALARIREIKIDEAYPYAAAILSPPPAGQVGGEIPEYNLATVKKRVGRDAVYTLQIAVYGWADRRKQPSAADLAEFRKAAEQAVIELRREGEEAYYYHGPFHSSVTVGVFGVKDHDDNKGDMFDSPVLQMARGKHPNHLVNGAGERPVGSGGKVGGLKPSFLVTIPE